MAGRRQRERAAWANDMRSADLNRPRRSITEHRLRVSTRCRGGDFSFCEHKRKKKEFVRPIILQEMCNRIHLET